MILLRPSLHAEFLGESIELSGSGRQFEFLFDSKIPFIYYFLPYQRNRILTSSQKKDHDQWKIYTKPP
jgi:hypothetical protein